MRRVVMMGIAAFVLASAAQAGQPTSLVRNLDAGRKQTVVTYGTSLTKGAWVGQMQALLARKYPNLVTVVNSGIGASNSQQQLEAFDDRVLAKKPDTVFLEFSFNDSHYKLPLAQSRWHLEEMIDRLLAMNPQCEVILQTMNVPVRDAAPSRADVEVYNQVFRDVAVDRGLLCLDNYPNWKKVLDADPALYDKYVPDGCHPEAPGYAAVVMPLLEKALFEGLPPANLAIRLTSPGRDASFDGPADLTLSAEVVGGGATKVEFLCGSTKIGEAKSAPFTCRWQGVGPGVYEVRARAVGASGATRDSLSHTVIVHPAGRTLGLRLHWNLNDGQGAKAADSSGNQNAGVLVGAPQWVGRGPGGALSFDGQRDEVEAQSVSGLDTGSSSIALWVEVPSATQSGPLVAVGERRTMFALGLGDDSFNKPGNHIVLLCPDWRHTGRAVGSGWHHVAATLTADGTVDVYVDGLMAMNYGRGEPPKNLVPGGTVRLAWDGYVHTACKLSDVRVYSRALTPTEVRALAKSRDAPMRP